MMMTWCRPEGKQKARKGEGIFQQEEAWMMMMMTWCRPEGKQKAREGEGIFQQEEAWMIIEQEDTIVHSFVLRQLLHNTASCCIIQDGRSKKFNFGELGHLDFWEQFVETADYAGPLFPQQGQH